MADDPKVELEATEETGDEATASPESTSSSGGDSAGSDDAAQAADTAREEYLAQLSARVARETVAELMRQGNGTGQGNQAASPPTAASGAVAALAKEREALDAEEARLQRAIDAEGLTAANLYAHQQYGIRDARWLAKVNLEATRMSEREREVSSKGNDDAWKRFVSTYPPGTDIELLRDAFEKRQEREAAKAPKKPGLKPDLRRPDPDRVVVDVSGASEVTATDRRARTMTGAQIEARMAHLRDSGDMDGYIKLGRDVKSGAVIRKG